MVDILKSLQFERDRLAADVNTLQRQRGEIDERIVVACRLLKVIEDAVAAINGGITLAATKPPLVLSVKDVTEAAPPPESPPQEPAPHAPVDQSAATPTIYEAIETVLLVDGGAMFPREIIDEAVRRWPSLSPESISSKIPRFANTGRLHKRDDGRYVLSQPKSSSPPPADDPVESDSVEPTPPSLFDTVDRILRERGPMARSTLITAAIQAGVRDMAIATTLNVFVNRKMLAKTADGRFAVAGTPPGVRKPDVMPKNVVAIDLREFEYGGRVIRLHPREWRIVSKLHLAMGKGFMGFDVLYDAAHEGERKAKNITPATWLLEMAGVINPKLAPLGLQMKILPKMGYFLAETGA